MACSVLRVSSSMISALDGMGQTVAGLRQRGFVVCAQGVECATIVVE